MSLVIRHSALLALLCATLLAGCDAWGFGQPATPHGTSTGQFLDAPNATAVAGSDGSEILFLRGGALVALSLAPAGERTIADDVHNFAAAP